MKPLKITMCAFGSYGSEQTIELTGIEQNIFLVTGDTGSGKSTIFDALVFALYGEASSNESGKSGEMMHSQFADNNVTPFVELEFEEGGEIYAVRRVPRHYEYKKNGEKKATAESQKVSLIMPDGTEYPSKETEAKLEEIVGLTKAQFMQVAMIAQGEFMQLLQESTKDKKKVFRKLFDTEIYEKIVEELESRIKVKNIDIARIKTLCQAEIKAVSIPEDYPLAEELLKTQKNLLANDKLSIALVEEFVADLKRLCEELKTKFEKADEEYKLCEKKYMKANDEKTAAETLAQQFENLEKADQKMRELAVEAKDIGALRELVQDIKKAYAIKTEHDKYIKDQKLFDDENEKLENNKKALPKLKENADLAQKEYDQASTAKTKCDTETSAIFEKVNTELDLFDSAAKLEKEEKELEQKVSTCQNSKKIAVKALEDFGTKLEGWKRRSQELAGADVALNVWENKGTELERINTAYTKVSTFLDACEKQKSNLAEIRKEYALASDEYKRINDEYTRKNTLYMDAQAGILAKTLKAGMACPVCGSIEHPNPAKMADEVAGLTFEILEELRKKVEEKNKRQGSLSSDAKNAGDTLQEKEKAFEDAKKALIADINSIFEQKIADDAELNTIKTELDKLEKAVGERLSAAKAMADELQQLNKNIGQADTKNTELTKAKDEANDALGEAEKAHTGKKAELKTVRDRITYSSKEAALKEKSEAEKEQREGEKKLSEATKKRKSADDLLVECTTNIKNSESKIPELSAEKEKSFMCYQTAMADNGMTEAKWKSIVEAEKSDTMSYEEKIRSYDLAKAAAETQRKVASEATMGREKPNMEAILANVKELESNKTKCFDARDSIKQASDTNNNAYEELCENLSNRGGIMKEYELLKNVYEVLAGKIKGAKMDIETFAQRYHLERILVAANERFFGMTGGQFELRTCSIERAGEGINRGLDLMVYSTVTGKEREIRTLSGGEKFMAALSLALGMADEIQARSSAVNLDILFIDEGFGTLDDNSRNEAIKVLKNMAGGDKLIGIISHVTELKQQIDDMLEVVKNDKGSHAVWKKS